MLRRTTTWGIRELTVITLFNLGLPRDICAIVRSFFASDLTRILYYVGGACGTLLSHEGAIAHFVLSLEQ